MNRPAIPISPVGRFIIVTFVCLFALSAAALLPVSGQTGASDVRVAVVLGNGPRATDEPTAVQTARCLKAFDLYRNGTVNKLVVTGGFTFDYISEARMMKIALVTWGVRPDDIVEDEMAASTVENALFSARLFEKRGWPKTALLVSQKFHLARADGIFKASGFQVTDAASAEAATRPEEFTQVPDMRVEAVLKTEPSDMIVVYEPYRSLEPIEWPTPALAHRLRAAAALYHAKTAPTIVLYNDRYTRGPVNIAQMMKVALVSLGVPPADVRAVGRREYRGLAELAAASGDKSARVLAPGTAKALVAPDSMLRWTFVFMD
jgi:uncharacterized SAM-binding protein YcdF (DUF218 family)